MIKALAPVAALLLSVAMLLMGNGLQSTLLPLRAQIEAFGSFEIGILGSAYFVGFALGCWRGAVVIRRAGHVRAFAAIVAVASTSALVHALVTDIVVWWFVRALTGACIAMLFMIIESWLNEKATNESRGTVFSVYTAINLSMISVGQVMIALGNPGGFPLFLVASILISWAAVPLALSRSESPAPVEHVGVRIGYLLKLSPVGFIGSFLVGASNGAFWSLAPIFAQGGQQNASAAAIFIAISVIGGAAAQYPLGKLSDRMDRRKLIIIVSLLAAASALALAIFGARSEALLMVTGFAFGMFAFPLYSLCVAHANDLVDSKSFVEAASGLLLTWAAGAVAGPLFASALMSQFGGRGLFFFTIAIHVGLAIFVAIRIRKRDAPPDETRGSFVEAANAGATISTVDVGMTEHQSGTGVEPDTGGTETDGTGMDTTEDTKPQTS
ncbi:MFS transporter [Minwuia sp.]|uniref:MFS transporter n=1 Tax=Minwuia sp. TaxID=2493630 RepID=UPI003A8F5A89